MKNTLHSLLTTALLGLAIGSFTATSAAAESGKSYPLSTCLVTDNKLGSMGKVITKVHQGQEIKFCCKPCVKKFDAKPDKYLPKLPR